MKTCRDALNGRVVAVLNTGSGSCDLSSADRARVILDEAGIRNAEVVSVGPTELTEALQAAVASADVLIVLGGDGTIGTAAGLCGGPSAPYLIPLPGGTMNMLPKSLYGAETWTDALAAVLASPVEQTVSGGDLSGHRFYCAAILGAPSLWADAREAVREGHLLEAAQRAVTATRRSLSDPVKYDFGSASGSAEAVAVICPLVSQALSDDERSLEAVALDLETATGLFGLAFHAVFDGWRNDPSVTRVKTRTVRVDGHGDLPIILDGEKVEIGRSATISFLPMAFRAMVPGKAIG